MPAVMPRRALAGERALGELRQGAAAHQGPQRPRLLLRPDARGGGDRPRAPRRPLVPRAAAEPLPDPGEVPRRGAPALRPHARARVHHEGRLLVPRRPRPTAEREYQRDVRRLHAHLRALRARRSAPVEADTGAIGGVAVARVPGARRVGRGRDRRAATRAATPPTSRRPRCAPRAAAGARGRRARARSRRPGKRTIEEVAAFLGAAARALRQDAASTDGDGDAVAVLVRGDHEASRDEAQGRARRRARSRWPTRTTVERVTGAPVGFAGPVGLTRAHPRRRRRCAARAAW